MFTLPFSPTWRFRTDVRSTVSEMDALDTLELASHAGLPWVDLSLVLQRAIKPTELGPELQLPMLGGLPLVAHSNRLQYLMPYQILALTDQVDFDRFTARQDDEHTLEFEDERTEEAELTQAPLVRYTRHLLLDAISQGASDIHINPNPQGYLVKFRIDGFLQTQPTAPGQLEKRLLARIKVMANLDLTESGQAQDGALFVDDAIGRRRRFRVSVLPSLHGEKAVLRLVGHASGIPELQSLGFTHTQLQVVRGLLQATQGLILITGPTGSGKSLTLGRMLLDLARDDRHVASVEDPIEFELPDVHQVQLNRHRNLNFPTSLRALLRQDPDVLMIGEIRDQETAEIAIQAAETGHLVLATLHTKRACDAPSRLAHFGIHAHHLKSTLRHVIAQRLVRTLCGICQGTGCGECHQGYRGRTGLFQFWRPSDPERPETDDYQESIVHQLTLGQTTQTEIQRVLGEHHPIPLPSAVHDTGIK